MRAIFFSLSQGDFSDAERPDLSEFRRNILVWMLLIEGVVCVAWQLFADNQLILTLSLGVHALAVWLAFKNLYLSGLAWALGVCAILTAVIGVYALPLAALFLCAAPLFAVLIFGYIEGAATLALVCAVGFLLPGWFPYIVDLDKMPGLVAGGGLTMLAFGTVLQYWLQDAIRTYYTNYLHAAHNLDEARDQRVEFKQVQDDLIHANRELSRVTRQLKAATQAAEEARRAKETFVATVSHELRTPLNMIIGFSEVIAQSPQVYGGRLPQTLLADIASIHRNSQHLLELVNDVLDLSQVDMGNLSIACSLCRMETIIDEAFEVIQPLFTSKGLYLNADIQPGMGDVYCDQTRIREVIINLLSNAGRFTDQGGVRVRAECADGQFTISVQDSGPGIANEDHSRLFEPFQQLDDSIRRKHGGSGLGLAISKRFVEMHGGRMWLESEVGSGTTFFFSLPMVAEAGPMPGGDASPARRWVNPYATVDARARSFKAPPAQFVPRCVVLEEGTVVQHIFERYLGNVEVAAAANLASALELVNTSPAHLLVINHPDAITLQAQAAASGSLPFDLQVLAFWLPGSTDMAASLHVRRYLIKPVSQETLLRVVEQFVEPGKTILLVDDNPEILQLFGRILSASERRYSVLRASNGQQGLDMLVRRKPELMVLDLVMPDLSGFDVLAEKERDTRIRGIPTIVISAQDPSGVQKIEGQVALARQGGFSPRDLLDLVQASGALKG